MSAGGLEAAHMWNAPLISAHGRIAPRSLAMNNPALTKLR
jgi:hypothetical protein